MSGVYNAETLLSFYADWLTWLPEKRAELEAQKARLDKKKPAPAPVKAAAPVAPVYDYLALAGLENPAETDETPGQEPPPTPAPVVEEVDQPVVEAEEAPEPEVLPTEPVETEKSPAAPPLPIMPVTSAPVKPQDDDNLA